ncbi:MAG: DNA mismatch repair protein MutS, partial [Bacilli bacterium]|nr:DNA mismatch repair protein MutS [Bacilli bacterium]
MSKIKYTPMMSQYLKIKENYQDTLILFRLGDFYELFFDDALIASKELELVLTGRDAGVKDRVPMCGVPYHAIDSYIDKLIKRGYKVGIVEQLEDPALAKGIVKRDVVQIMSPGTLIGVGLKEKENNYILAIHDYDLFYTMAFCDISTGELGVLNVEHDSDKLINEIMTFESKELLVNNVFNTKIFSDIKERLRITISRYNDIELTLDYENLISEVKDLHQIETLKFLIDYLVNTQKRSLDYLQNAKIIKTNQYLKMDSFTRNNLELTRTLRSEDRYGSLLWVIDKTKTAMGSRLLKSWIQRPLVLQSEIEERLVIVDALINNFIVREELVKQLDSVYDLPRLIAKISYGNANGRDLIQLANSLSALPKIKEVLQSSGDKALIQLSKRIEIMKDIVDLIGISIVDNPPISVKEGGLIKTKYNKDLD